MSRVRQIQIGKVCMCACACVCVRACVRSYIRECVCVFVCLCFFQHLGKSSSPVVELLGQMKT